MDNYKEKTPEEKITICKYTTLAAVVLSSIILPTLTYFTYMEFENGNYGQSFMCALSLAISSYFPVTAVVNNKMRNEIETELSNLETKINLT